MTSWIALSKTDHLDMYWKPRDGFAFTREMQVVPVAISELSKLLPHYCITFIKEDEDFKAVVLLGLGEVKNVYVNNDNKWLAGYVPASLRAFPFILGKTDDDKKILCIKQSHLHNDGDHKLFGPDGELTKDVTAKLELLNQTILDSELNSKACRILNDAGLMIDWKLTVKTSHTSDQVEIKGLFTIDEKKLNQLAPDEFARLRDCGALVLAYAHLFSLNQIDQISQRVEYSKKVRNVTESQDLQGLFNDGGSLNLDSLNFDNE
jgi:hypothetical protein